MLRSGRLSLGPKIEEFEERFAERVGAPYAAAVSSGTAGLHLLCRIAGLGARRRGDHVAVLLRRLGELLHLRGRDAGVRGHRPADAEHRSGRGRGRDHGADARDRRGRHLRLPVRARPAPRAGGASRAGADPGLLRGARRALQGRDARLARPAGGLRVLPEQADDDGRGRDRHDPLRGGVAAAQEPAQPGPRRHRRLARPHLPGLQLPDGRHRRRDRHRPAREAGRDPRRCARPSRRATPSCSPASTASSRCARTTPTTSAPGSSTSSSSTAASTATA